MKRSPDRDTDIGGPDGRFPVTRNSAVQGARAGDRAVRELAHERIVTAYWKPVYKYLRIRWNADNEQAKDLTQGYFAAALEDGLFRKYDASRGSFRNYLRMSVDGYAGNERKAAGRLKRGGGLDVVPLDFESAEGELRVMDISGGMTPEDCFDREWVRHLFTLSVEELREALDGSGRTLRWALFESYDLGEGGDESSYHDLASRFDIPVTQVTNHLAAARRDFRRILLRRLREITQDDAEFRSEARRLLKADTP